MIIATTCIAPLVSRKKKMNTKLTWHVLNLTPHLVNILNEEMTIQDRHGKIRLREGYIAENAIINSFPPASKPLSVTEVGMGIVCDSIPFYSPISAAGVSFIPNSQDIENCDIIIVSQKCANLINAQVPLMQQGQMSFPMDPILLDKFYIPYNVVYENRKPIGALGLQKVTSYLPLYYYANAINNGRRVSLPGLLTSCAQYTALPEVYRQSMCQYDGSQTENALKVANAYILKKGYRPYPELWIA